MSADLMPLHSWTELSTAPELILEANPDAPPPDAVAPTATGDHAATTATDLFVVQADSPESMAQAQQLAQQVQDGNALIVELSPHSDGLDQLGLLAGSLDGLERVTVIAPSDDGALWLGDRAWQPAEILPQLLQLSTATGTQVDVLTDCSVDRPADIAPTPITVTTSAANPAGTDAGAMPATIVRHEIAFVDTQVADYQRLVDDLKSQASPDRQIDIVLLDANADGIQQISNALQGRQGIDSIQIFSHGVDGAVELGGTWLNNFALESRADAIAAWGASLSAGADILLYGCDVAADAQGQAFVDGLARLTGADVAASDNMTGQSALGGDWTLEYRTGDIARASTADATALQDWSGLLAISSNGTSTSAQTSGATSLTWSHTVANGTNRALFVELSIDQVGATVSSVTYGGVAMTRVGRTAGNHAVEIWRLVNPTVGTANVVVNFSATTAAAGGATTYNGVSQTTPTGTYAGASGTGTTMSVVASSAAGDLVIDSERWDNNPSGYTVGSGQTQQWTQTQFSGRGVATTEAGAASVTMSSSVSSFQQWEIGAVSIRAYSNSAPVLADTNLSMTVVEDAGAPSGAIGSLVSDFAGGISDADSGAVGGIAITASDETNGTWYYTTDGGTNWTAVGSVSSASSLLLADNASTRLYFAPAANYSGVSTSALTIRAWDQTSGSAGTKVSTASTGGSTAFSSATDVVDVTVTAVNDPPVATADSYVVNEDSSLAVNWWNTSWTRRSQITLSGNTFSGATTLTNFPILLKLNSGNIDYSQTQNGGQDLRFFDSSGNSLDYQVESWNEAGNSYVWVNVPTVDTTGTQAISMYYGNATAAAGQDATAVWNSSYSAVYHLNDSGTTIDDSTSNANGGTATNGPASATGQVAGDLSFDGANDYVDLGNNRSFSDGASGATFSMWIKPSTVAAGTYSILEESINNGGASTQNSRMALEQSGANLAVIVRSDDSTACTITTTTNPLAAGVWHQVSAVVDVLGNTVKIYVDGVLQATSGTVNLPNSTFPNTSSATTSLAAQDDGASGYFGGQLDEVRISSVAETAAWVKSNYLTQTNAFVTIGAASSAPATGGVLSNDSDVDSPKLTAILVSGPSHAASFTFNPDGTFSYTPTANYSGPDSFTYYATDGSAQVISLNADSGLKGRYTFDDPADLGNDSSPLGANDGTPTNGPAAATDPTRGAVLDFDGVNDYVQVAGRYGNQANITLAAWVNLTAADTGGAEIISLGDSVALRADQSGGVGVAGFIYNGSSWVTLSSGTNIAGTGWHFLAYTFDDAGNTNNLYIDGNLVASAAITTSISYTKGANTQIGRHGNGGTSFDFNGSMDDVRVYNRALTATEIAALAADYSFVQTATASITVNAVNDAPVLADTALALTVAEDAGAPSGAVGSLVSAFTGGISDVDSGAVKGIAITATNETNGTWYYTTNGGSTWTAVGAVSSASSLLLADNASTRLYFAPAANYNGSSTSALTLRGWDQTSGTAGTKVDTSTNGGTTAFSSATDVIDVTVTAVNDAPVLADTALTLTVAEDAGAPSGAVGSLLSAFTGGISDVDSGAVKGIAITATNVTNGTWYYTTNGGSTWTAVGAVSSASSLLLADNASTRLYFAPAANYNGSSTSALTLRGWDQTSGTAGTKVDTSTNGGSTAFSSATDVIDVTVTAVNDAPVASGSATLAAINEDTAAPAGATVSSLFSGNFSDSTDQVSGGSSANTFAGIAISSYTVDAAKGNWQYSTNSGSTWTTLGSATTTTAITLDSAASTLLRFVLAANYNGAATTLAANLIESGLAITNGASINLTGATGGTTHISSATVALAETINAVNDAPVLADTALTLTVAEDAGAPSGAVGSLLSAFTGGISDVDSGAVKGIAITASNETNGTWYYTTNGGSTWTAVGAVSSASSLLLADNASTRLYFAPAANYNGSSTSALTLRGWDQTSGTAGTKVDTSTNGGSTAFSSATDVIDVTVTAVNDAPVASGSATLAAINEDTAAPAGATVSSLFSGNFSDSTDQVSGGSSANTFAGIAISSYTVDAAKGNWQYSTNSGSTWTTLGSATTTTAITLDSAASTLLRFVLAANYNGAATTLAANLIESGLAITNGASINLTGATGGTTHISSATVALAETINAVNDAPVLADTALTLTVAEDAGAPSGAVGSLLSAFTGGISDVDSGAVKGIAITASNETNGTWYYTTNGGSTWTAVGAVSSASSLLLADNASTRLYFAPAANYNGSSTSALTLRGWDQTSGTAGTKVDTSSNGGATAFSSATDVIDVTVTAVNDAPVLADTALTLTVAEDAGAPSGAVGSLVSAFTGGISDVDSGAVKGIAITATNETNGTWYYTTNGGSTWTAVGAVNATSSLLLADNASTRLYFAPSANYNGNSTSALTLRGWDQTSGTAGTKVDTSSNGGNTAFSSATDVIDVTVTAVNDAPVLADTALTLTVAEDAGAPSGAVGSLVSAFTGGISDVDSGAVKGIAITATNETNGTWYYTTNGGSTWTAVGAVNATSSLLLADNANTRLYFAPAANFNGSSTSALTLRGWDQTSGAAGTKVDTSTNGGTTAFSSATDVIDVTVTAVNDAPVLADTALTLTVAEDAGAPSGAVGSLVSAFTGGISDVDSGAVQGIAITATNETNGTWYYTTNGGTNWTAVGAVSSASSLLLADNASTRLYFAPAANYNGSSTSALTLRGWDQTSGTAGTKVDTSTNGGSTAFSSATDVIDVTVTAVNDAPVASGSATLAAINEDTASPAGATISSLFSGNFSDATDQVSGGSSANTFAGIAISSYTVDAAKGNWQYSTNSGSTWTTLGSATTTTAITLDAAASTLLRFVPAANYNGAATALTRPT